MILLMLRRGYYRKGKALFLLDELRDAVLTYEAGIQHDPANEELWAGSDYLRPGRAEASDLAKKRCVVMEDTVKETTGSLT